MTTASKHCLLMLWNAYLVLVIASPLVVVPFAMSAYHARRVLREVFADK